MSTKRVRRDAPGDASVLLALPLELLPEIFSHLTRREAAGAKGTCRVLRDVCRSLESEEPGRKLYHRLRLMVACSSTAEVVEFSLRGQDPPKRVAVGRAWAKSDKVKRFRRKDGPWLTGIALSPDGDRLYCQCYHEVGTVVLDGKTLEYKRMYLPPQKEWRFPPEHPDTPLMPGDWQIQGPEGIACAGDKVYTTFADGKVGCIYLNKAKAYAPMSLAAGWIDRYVHNLGSLWMEGTDPIYAFCQTATARHCCEIYARLGEVYEQTWRPNAPTPSWKLAGPCCFHRHAPGAMQEPYHQDMIEQGLEDNVFKVYGYVAWGCDVGPDGALYVAVDRDHQPTGNNYTLPPGKCPIPTCERRKTGVIMRVVFADYRSVSSQAIIGQEFYTKGEHLARPSGLTFTPDGDMLVASMDGCVSKFGGPRSPRRGEFLGVFHSLKARDERYIEGMSKEIKEMVDEGGVPAGLATLGLDKIPLQPLDVWAPRRQGGRVFISVHRALEKSDPLRGWYDDAGVIVCDGAGNEIDFIRDPHIAEHCNMMTGE
ncbi:predicted protein [Micromonas commoda]|uniref:F-box domain-containing protein n=1 Tax=Micromonas commoda (strain RCC299 / NOUM17 / CCMP2709) TaxID=296587 RepID=C1E633_MICCC|nr:predicted protein [Micromonas commoda]ACO63357.1 predicted protein [Micromonas commoda]|eukprot:XP_002502099.1 predicted protein [Micromonas commoda]